MADTGYKRFRVKSDGTRLGTVVSYGENDDSSIKLGLVQSCKITGNAKDLFSCELSTVAPVMNLDSVLAEIHSDTKSYGTFPVSFYSEEDGGYSFDFYYNSSAGDIRIRNVVDFSFFIDVEKCELAIRIDDTDGISEFNDFLLSGK